MVAALSLRKFPTTTRSMKRRYSQCRTRLGSCLTEAPRGLVVGNPTGTQLTNSREDFAADEKWLYFTLASWESDVGVMELMKRR